MTTSRDANALIQSGLEARQRALLDSQVQVGAPPSESDVKPTKPVALITTVEGLATAANRSIVLWGNLVVAVDASLVNEAHVRESLPAKYSHESLDTATVQRIVRTEANKTFRENKINDQQRRKEIISEIEALKASVDASAPMFSSPVGILNALTIKSTQRAAYEQMLKPQGAAALTALALKARAEADKDLAAAILNTHDSWGGAGKAGFNRGDVGFDRNELAKFVLNGQFERAQAAIEIVRRKHRDIFALNFQYSSAVGPEKVATLNSLVQAAMNAAKRTAATDAPIDIIK